MSVINTRSFGRFWPVSWTITHRFGVPKRSPWLSNSKVRLRRSSRITVWADSGTFLGLLRFWPISWTITHCFVVPKRFPLLLNHKVRLRVGRQHSQFWPILAHFLDYYSLFWAPGVISTIDEPWGAFACRSSTLVVSADSGPFHGLLLSFGAPK